MPLGESLWLATRNEAKLREARAILAKFHITVRRLRCPKLEIQSHDISEIASFAADHLSRKRSGLIAVEDSGLFVKSLGGFPGPFSSYAYETIGPSGILRLLGSSRNRSAYFQASIAVSRSGRTLRVFLGTVNGTIAWWTRGTKGFGFDPIFVPRGSKKTFGEMGGARKNLQSHRQSGLRKLARWYMAS